jgi:dihydrofolate synthase/folylpolyglutamate synthase
VKDATLIRVLPTVQLIGRFQYLNTHPDIIIDVAHNPQAAQSLSENLAELQQNMPKDGRLIAVFAMLADKDIDAVVRVLQHQIDAWHVAELHHPRAAKLSELINVLAAAQVKVPVQAHPSIQLALMDACKNMTKNDKIIVFGSFFTVAAVLDHWQPHCFQS